jgi:hypothetical protein
MGTHRPPRRSEEAGPVEFPGGPHEAGGNAGPRWMAATPGWSGGTEAGLWPAPSHHVARTLPDTAAGTAMPFPCWEHATDDTHPHPRPPSATPSQEPAHADLGPAPGRPTRPTRRPSVGSRWNGPGRGVRRAAGPRRRSGGVCLAGGPRTRDTWRLPVGFVAGRAACWSDPAPGRRPVGGCRPRRRFAWRAGAAAPMLLGRGIAAAAGRVSRLPTATVVRRPVPAVGRAARPPRSAARPPGPTRRRPGPDRGSRPAPGTSCPRCRLAGR